jgi:hypothetical protein
MLWVCCYWKWNVNDEVLNYLLPLNQKYTLCINLCMGLLSPTLLEHILITPCFHLFIKLLFSISLKFIVLLTYILCNQQNFFCPIFYIFFTITSMLLWQKRRNFFNKVWYRKTLIEGECNVVCRPIARQQPWSKQLYNSCC